MNNHTSNSETPTVMKTSHSSRLIVPIGTMSTKELNDVSRWLGPGVLGTVTYEIVCNPSSKDVMFLKAEPDGGYSELDIV